MALTDTQKAMLARFAKQAGDGWGAFGPGVVQLTPPADRHKRDAEALVAGGLLEQVGEAFRITDAGRAALASH